MLDVHPPHEPTHTWKDFFIHIATIVIGLLIAVGLEQTVEHFHRRHQVSETREALRAEHEEDRVQLNTGVVMLRRERASLNNNLMVLEYIKQHPGTPQAELPGIVTWHSDMDTLSTAAWVTASQSSVLVSLPEDEVRAEGDFYSHINLINRVNDAYWVQLNDAARYTFRDPDPTHMTPAELDHTIALTQQSMEALHLLAVAIMNINDHFPEYAKGLTHDEIDAFSHMHKTDSDPALAGPIAQTIARIDAAGKLNDYFPQSVPAKK